VAAACGKCGNGCGEWFRWVGRPLPWSRSVTSLAVPRMSPYLCADIVRLRDASTAAADWFRRTLGSSNLRTKSLG
jgi:hypothetical protein